MNTRLSPAALASIILAACGLVLFTAGCRSDRPGEKDELAGVTQFVVNGSFEELDGQLPKGWRTRSWQRDGDAAFDVESSGHSGGRSVSISSAKGAIAHSCVFIVQDSFDDRNINQSRIFRVAASVK